MSELSPDRSDESALFARVRASEDLYARAFMSNPFALSLTDGQTDRFTHVNAAFAELVGYNRSELIGATSASLGLWADRARRDEIAAELRRRGYYPPAQGEIVVRSGQRVAVIATFRLLDSDPPSVLTGLVALAPPDTEKPRA